MSAEFYGGYFLGLVTALVVGILIAISREIKKSQDNLKIPPPVDNRITDIVVDAIAFEIDIWNGLISYSLLMDANWKIVAVIDLVKLYGKRQLEGSQFMRATVPINAVKKLQSPMKWFE